MKRDEALAALSRDHHQALFRALRLKRVRDDDRGEVREDMLAFFGEHGARHFRVEEEVLLPGCAHRVDPTHEAVVRVLTDHVWIRRRVLRLAADELDLEGMRELGERLDAHVRHEERTLFPLIEAELDAAELRELGRAVEAAERA